MVTKETGSEGDIIRGMADSHSYKQYSTVLYLGSAVLSLECGVHC